MQLLPVPGSELDDRRKRLNAREHVGRGRTKQPLFGACDAVPRQVADGVEPGRAEWVVQIPRGQLPRLQHHVITDVGRKLRGSSAGLCAIDADNRTSHQLPRTRRNVAYTYG